MKRKQEMFNQLYNFLESSCIIIIGSIYHTNINFTNCFTFSFYLISFLEHGDSLITEKMTSYQNISLYLKKSLSKGWVKLCRDIV